MNSPNFSRVLTDLEDMLAERRDALSDARAEEQGAWDKYASACSLYDIDEIDYESVKRAEAEWHEKLGDLVKAKAAL